MSKLTMRSFIAAYPTFLHRLYCLVRFRIIKTRFLDEIGQYLPSQGNAMEVGCGFGLFSLYFGSTNPELRITGVDVNERRIAIAEQAKSVLGIENVEFRVEDARGCIIPSRLSAIYMLDLLHHMPIPAGTDLLKHCRESLADDGVLIIKDVDTRPRFKMAFTWILDVLMLGGELPNYRSRRHMIEELHQIGFDVVRHSLIDILPYPHELYICKKSGGHAVQDL